jgi:diaminopimelate epimerase
MTLGFSKYHGTGNDFIIIDNRRLKLKLKTKQIASLCHRKFGIGADGLMLLQNKNGFDFEMVYFNSDGNESSFCGNGSRCIVAFAKELGVVTKSETTFVATDGAHTAKINKKIISMKMRDVKNIEVDKNSYLLNTGSPHYVDFLSGVKDANIVEEGRKIRYSNKFKKEGVNVNLVEKQGNKIFVRTYERGVEDETLSCGTGVTASALASALRGVSTTTTYCKVATPGGELMVHFAKEKNNSFTDVWLEGPATFVFKGEIKI